MNRNCFLIICLFFAGGIAQTETAYETDDSKSKGLLDPSRMSIHHSLGFGMAKGGSSSLQSQSLYSTMIQYKISDPLTLNLNFSLPIHSTFSPSQNLSADNLKSADYFRSVPFDVALTWQPRENMFMRLRVVKRTSSDGTLGYHSRYLFNDPLDMSHFGSW